MDTVLASYKQLEELERVFEERCGKSYQRVRGKENIPNISTTCTFALGSLSYIIDLFKRRTDVKSMMLIEHDGLNALFERKIRFRLNQLLRFAHCPDMIEGTDKLKLYSYIQHIASVAFSRFQSDRRVVEKKTKKTTNRTKWTSLFLEIFVLCLRCIVKQFPSKIGSFLNAAWNPDDSDNPDDIQLAVQEMVSFFHRAAKEILIDHSETETSKLAKKELVHLFSVMEILCDVGLDNIVKGETISSSTVEFIEEVMLRGRIDEPKLIALVVEQLLRASRTFTGDFNTHAIELASDLHFNFDDISKQANKVLIPEKTTEKTESYFRMLAGHGRCAESKSKETLVVLCDQMKPQYYELEITIKRYQSSIPSVDDENYLNITKTKKKLLKAITTQLYQYSVVIKGLLTFILVYSNGNTLNIQQLQHTNLKFRVPRTGNLTVRFLTLTASVCRRPISEKLFQFRQIIKI